MPTLPLEVGLRHRAIEQGTPAATYGFAAGAADDPSLLTFAQLAVSERVSEPPNLRLKINPEACGACGHRPAGGCSLRCSD